MIKLYISKEADRKFQKLSLKNKNKVKKVLKIINEGKLLRLRKLPATNLYFSIVGSYALMLTRENGSSTILIDILTKRELINEMRRARFGI